MHQGEKIIYYNIIILYQLFYFVSTHWLNLIAHDNSYISGLKITTDWSPM